MLNPQQKLAVETTDGPVIIVAGPGTGKTFTFAHRVAHLLKSQSVPPENILAVTFTKSAAAEMKARLKTILPDVPLDNLWVETFHAAALRILREQNYPYGEGVALKVLDEEQQIALVEGLLPRKEISPFLNAVRRGKQRLVEPSSPAAIQYQSLLRDAKVLDFDDLFLCVCRLFDERPPIAEQYRQRFQYILVDEFQDTSFAQYEFLRCLAGENICVIGDPDQAIYGFSGNDFIPFETFQRDYPTAKIISLSENYRSQSSIVEAAKQVIHKNRSALPRELRAKLEQGLPLEIAAHQSDKQEAEMIVRRIEGLLGGASTFTIDSDWAKKESESYSYGLNDIAVLYRFHAQARLIEQALERAGLPYQTFGKKLKRNGETVPADNDLRDYAENESAPFALTRRGEGITLMTLHRSKGLEFPVVFMAGCEDGLLPATILDDGNATARLEEERRLFYVGMTRAKRRLFLSHARERFLFGQTLQNRPCPFILDIQEELRVLQEERAATKKRPAKAKQTTLFDL